MSAATHTVATSYAVALLLSSFVLLYLQLLAQMRFSILLLVLYLVSCCGTSSHALRCSTLCCALVFYRASDCCVCATRSDAAFYTVARLNNRIHTVVSAATRSDATFDMATWFLPHYVLLCLQLLAPYSFLCLWHSLRSGFVLLGHSYCTAICSDSALCATWFLSGFRLPCQHFLAQSQHSVLAARLCNRLHAAISGASAA
eukprot:COSAG02_NODE_8379_length_2591_cov_16.860754_1_plen_201_part_00